MPQLPHQLSDTTTLDNKDHGKDLMHKLLLEGRLEVKRLERRGWRARLISRHDPRREGRLGRDATAAGTRRPQSAARNTP